MSSYQYRKSHCRDKTILRPSYLHNGISYTDKMASLCWIRAQVPFSIHGWSRSQSMREEFYMCNVFLTGSNLAQPQTENRSRSFHLRLLAGKWHMYYSDVIIGEMASQITSLPIVYLTVYSGTYQRKHQGSVSLAFVRGIHRWPMISHKGPVTRKMFPFDDVFMVFHWALMHSDYQYFAAIKYICIKWLKRMTTCVVQPMNILNGTIAKEWLLVAYFLYEDTYSHKCILAFYMTFMIGYNLYMDILVHLYIHGLDRHMTPGIRYRFS